MLRTRKALDFADLGTDIEEVKERLVVRPADALLAKRMHEHDCRNGTITLAFENRRGCQMKELVTVCTIWRA